MRFVIRAGKVLTPKGCTKGQVIVEGQRILGVEEHYDPSSQDQVIFAPDDTLCPGFVDVHVHGGGGFSVNSGNSDDVIAMAKAHAVYGTTSVLPTTLAAPMEQLLSAVNAVRDAAGRVKGASILGVHLEGPCLNPLQSGAQAPGSLLVPAEADIAPLLDAWPEGLVMMGAAPELAGGLSLGETLCKRGVVASIAHSDATYYQVQEAIRHGYSNVTHLYSSCSGLKRVNSYRIPGVIEAGLNLDELTVQVIADGKHLPKELLQLIYRCKGADRIQLITDGLEFSASSLTEGTVYRQLNGMDALYEDGVMKLTDRQSFAGSVATLSRCVKNMVEAGVPLPEAVRMASTNPARLAGAKRKGAIASGMDADLVLLDKSLAPRWVMAMGEIVK